MAGTEIEAGKTEAVGRALGTFESFSTCLSGLRSSGVYWHAAVINTSHPLEDDDVINACKIIVRKQEVLQMRIVQTDKTHEPPSLFRFMPMENPEKIDFESTTFKFKHDWPMFICKDHGKHKIDILNGPLWRIIFGPVEESDCPKNRSYQYILLLKFVHVIVDGISVFDLLNNQFLPVLSALINGVGAENIIPYLHQVESAECLFPEAQILISWREKLEFDFVRWKNRTFKSDESLLYMFPDEKARISLNEELKTLVVCHEAPCVPKILQEELCGSIIKTTKKHDVTVHCVLLASGVVALSRTANLAKIKLPRFFKQVWPINLRKFLHIKTPQPLGLLVAEGRSVHETMADYTVTVDDFWKLCKDIQKQVRNGTSMDPCIQYIKGIKYFMDASEKTDLRTVLSEMGSPPCLFLSNLGNTVADPDVNTKEGPKKMRVSEQYFSMSGLGVTKWPPLSQFILTFGQRFMWNTVYNPKKVSKRFVETYLEQLQDVFETFCVDQK